jgi:hypothetical protein
VPWNQPIEVPNTNEIWFRGKRVKVLELGGRLSSTTTTTTSPIVKALGQNS